MRRFALIVSLFLACHRSTECPALDPDAGTTLQTPCASKPDGMPCCLGVTPGNCRSNECAPK